MKNVLYFVFVLAFALVLSHQDEQKRGGLFSRSAAPVKPETLTANALSNLVEANEPIELNAPEISSQCIKDMAAKKVANQDNGLLYDYQTTCYVIGRGDLTMSVKSKSEPKSPTALSQAFQAVFLPFEVDKNTYMILDPSVVRWFFTSTLSGCDIFVARPKSTAPVASNRPIVVHSNLNKCLNNLQNLKSKGDSVDALMGSHPNYELIARVYSEPLAKEKMQADQYFQKYKATHPGIKLISYQVDPPAIPQAFYFFGYYLPEQWKFIIKGAVNGQLTSVVNVPNL